MIHNSAKYHRRKRTHPSSKNSRANNSGRRRAAVLGAVGDYVDWQKLEGRNVNDQEGAHGLAGNSTVPIKTVQFLKCQQSGTGAGMT